jgi:Rrf2 family protein
VHISAKADYAMRALLTLAASDADTPVKAEEIARRQGMPLKFLENILVELRKDGLVASHRGADGGYRLAKAPEETTVAAVIRAVDGPLAEVRGIRPEDAEYQGDAEHLQEVWVAVRASLRNVLEAVTLADIVAGRLPRSVGKLTEDPDAWTPH